MPDPTLFFTSDHHFGHANILRFCGRPFISVDKMDEEMIQRWNARVRAWDIVYHLGDFTLGDEKEARKYFSRLNGEIRVLGNTWHHDRRWLPHFNLALQDGRFPKLGRSKFRTASGHRVVILPALLVLEFPELGNRQYPQALVLCHYPLAEWDRKHHGAWHLHGHSHGKHASTGLCFDVGVDCNQFYPISLDGVTRQMKAYQRPSPLGSAPRPADCPTPAHSFPGIDVAQATRAAQDAVRLATGDEGKCPCQALKEAFDNCSTRAFDGFDAFTPEQLAQVPEILKRLHNA